MMFEYPQDPLESSVPAGQGVSQVACGGVRARRIQEEARPLRIRVEEESTFALNLVHTYPHAATFTRP